MNDVSWTSWLLFAAIAAILLAIDLFAHRGGKETSHRWAIIWSVIWIIAGLLFSVYVWYHFHALAAQEYLAAYLMEKSLSLDNLFVFLLIFQTLNIPHDHQHKALFWGILGRGRISCRLHIRRGCRPAALGVCQLHLRRHPSVCRLSCPA